MNVLKDVFQANLGQPVAPLDLFLACSRGKPFWTTDTGICTGDGPSLM